MIIKQQRHAALYAVSLATEFDAGLGSQETPAEVMDMLAVDYRAPLKRDEHVKKSVRDMMRTGGYKPTGRGKPASEYLLKAVSENRLGSINPCVDVLNIVSLHSGFPISVVDLDKVTAPLTIASAPPETRFIFNASGQEIKLDGLVCLFDAEGPCANGVKDSQRTKTADQTTRTLSVIWGVGDLSSAVDRAAAWYADLLRAVGGQTSWVDVVTIPD